MKLIALCLLIPFILFPQETKNSHLLNIEKISNNFSYEIRYATPNNFIGETLYDCAICLLQPKVAEALIEANQYFCNLGYRIKIYDCYRPLDIQKKMWEKVPRPTYVANPYTKGSIHNRGAAIDLTLETLDGCFVDMGSDYDFLGSASHIDNYHFSEEILAHRKLLFDGMRKFGFNTIRTEWWHFSYKNNYQYPILNAPFHCEE
ncbi:MAG: M15 family metallopeptidase [Flavobacteriales bacterium]